MTRLTRRLAGDERGAIFVITAIGMITFLVMAAFVIDVANWREHKRHLQNQVDAGAFAAGSRYIIPRCGDGTAAGNTDEDAVVTVARQYAGETGFSGAVNPQVSGKAVQVRINSANYPDQGGSNFDIAGSGTTTEPCDPYDGFLITDVKATDQNVGGFFRALGLNFLPDIRARARVRVEGVDESEGSLPLGIPDLRPVDVWIEFINECAGGALIHREKLVRGSSSGGVIPWTAAAPFTVNIPAATAGCNAGASPASTASLGAAGVGTRVILTSIAGGGATPPPCSDEYVFCYDEGSGNGLYFTRGVPSGGASPDAWVAGNDPRNTFLPVLGNVTLTGSGSCANPSFMRSNCTSFGVSAVINSGTTANPGFPPTNAATRVTYNVRANGVPMTQSGGVWTAANVPASAGPNPVTITWDWIRRDNTATWRGINCTNGSSSPCQASGSFGVVQRAFRADAARSGVIETLAFDIPFQSVPAGGPVSITTATVGTSGAVAFDPAQEHLLRLSEPQGSQLLNCDPDNQGGQRENEIKFGCPTDPNNPNPARYKVNQLNDPAWYPCQDASWLWPLPRQPAWQCIRVSSGLTANKVHEGFVCRTGNVVGGVCPASGTMPADVCNNPNYWAQYNNGTRDLELLKSDRRNVRLFIVPYGSFDAAGSGGNKTVPVLGFARFYITGWEGNSALEDPCPSADDDFDLNGDGPPYEPLPQGAVVGHFHMFVPEPPGSGGLGNGEPCGTITGTDPTPCVVVLVD